MRSTGNAERDFAALMKTHHMGAAEMAQQVIAKGKDTTTQVMARRMVSDQQWEINELDAFLNQGDTAVARAAGGDAFFQASQLQMNNMKMDRDHSGSAYRQFVQMMIQGGIDMAKAYLQHGAKDAKLKTIANNIIRSQQQEIREMQALLQRLK